MLNMNMRTEGEVGWKELRVLYCLTQLSKVSMIYCKSSTCGRRAWVDHPVAIVFIREESVRLKAVGLLRIEDHGQWA